MSDRLRIIVAGLIGQHPLLAGMSWHHVQYVVGLERLGHDIYYLEDSGEWPYNLDGGPSGDDWVVRDCTQNVSHLADVMSRFGLEDRWAYRFAIEDRWFGMSDARRSAAIASADLLINLSGSLWRPWEYRQVERLAYVDTDPAITQLKLALGDPALQGVDEHDVLFSFGERFDGVPATPYRWRHTRQPILLSEWQPSQVDRGIFTTVMNWTSYKPQTYEGRTYGQKDVEFLRFLDLPRSVAPVQLEVALPHLRHPEWETVGDRTQGRGTHDLLAQHGWRTVDATEACAGLDGYRSYIASSRGEWTVAKNAYIRARTGWFSERSACYLAAGRPVVMLDTGLAGVLPTGEGILPYSTVDEAIWALEEADGNHERHARAARELAAEYFDSRSVLTRLLEDAAEAEKQPRAATLMDGRDGGP